MWRDNQICDVFKTAKMMVRTSQQYIFGKLCIKKDEGVLAINNEDKKIA